MSIFLNSMPEVNQFTKQAKDEYYVDKTGLIEKLNKLIGTSRQFVCITRPRRFGKSVNAMMLVNYYSKHLDTREMFDKFKISKEPSYLQHLNKHNVIFMSFTKGEDMFKTYDEFKGYFTRGLKNDLKEIVPTLNEDLPISDIFDEVYKQTKEGFIFIIDEWDYIFNNELYKEEERKDFLKFLTDLLKDKAYVELAYMTGILPIAKHSSKSTLNMFKEFSALDDEVYEEFFGFTQQEVEKLCAMQDKVTLEQLEEWYNGYYTQKGEKLYNPRSVVCAVEDGTCKSYWVNTGKLDDIAECIHANVDEIRDDIVNMIQGKSIVMELSEFSSERLNLDTRKQILSAMVILGFLSYHDGMINIPNKELKMKFADTLENNMFGDFAKVAQNSIRMLAATLEKDTDTMARLLREAHSLYTPVLKYNDENSLACVLTIVYLSALKRYRVEREDKAGEGFADFIFYPYKRSNTAFIVELKVNKTTDEAIQQIKDRRYPQKLQGYTGEKLAIGIVYDSKNKKHEVKIEELV